MRVHYSLAAEADVDWYARMGIGWSTASSVSPGREPGRGHVRAPRRQVGAPWGHRPGSQWAPTTKTARRHCLRAVLFIAGTGFELLTASVAVRIRVPAVPACPRFVRVVLTGSATIAPPVVRGPEPRSRRARGGAWSGSGGSEGGDQDVGARGHGHRGRSPRSEVDRVVAVDGAALDWPARVMKPAGSSTRR